MEHNLRKNTESLKLYNRIKIMMTNMTMGMIDKYVERDDDVEDKYDDGDDDDNYDGDYDDDEGAKSQILGSAKAVVEQEDLALLLNKLDLSS